MEPLVQRFNKFLFVSFFHFQLKSRYIWVITRCWVKRGNSLGSAALVTANQSGYFQIFFKKPFGSQQHC
jgi:hypothetical protein